MSGWTLRNIRQKEVQIAGTVNYLQREVESLPSLVRHSAKQSPSDTVFSVHAQADLSTWLTAGKKCG